MYAVGHLALGYLSGKATSKLLNVDAEIPLLFFLSIIPDIDLSIPGLVHRGPTHSVILAFLLFLPLFIVYRRKATPYFIALIQHPLIGDYLTGDTQLLWPATTNWYGTGIPITSPINITMELVLFTTSLAIILYTRDAWTLLQHHPSNPLLAVPALTVFLPVFFCYPMTVPSTLIVPHLAFMLIFAASILTDLRHTLREISNAV